MKKNIKPRKTTFAFEALEVEGALLDYLIKKGYNLPDGLVTSECRNGDTVFHSPVTFVTIEEKL